MTLYVKGYGVSDLTTQEATQPCVIFEIGSITKQFTAALIMKLQELGKLHVDDSIVLYLPEYNFPAAVTLRMMLTHTSGLADFTNFPQLGDWVKHGSKSSLSVRLYGTLQAFEACAAREGQALMT